MPSVIRLPNSVTFQSLITLYNFEIFIPLQKFKIGHFMKTKFKLTLIFTLVIMTFVSIPSYALIVTYTLHLQKIYKSSNEENNPIIEQDLIGQRSPQYAVLAHINKSDGIVLPGVLESDILSYEAYDEKGNRTGIYHNNWEFTHFVLSQKGTIQVRIEFDDYWLCGYINL